MTVGWRRSGSGCEALNRYVEEQAPWQLWPRTGARAASSIASCARWPRASDGDGASVAVSADSCERLLDALGAPELSLSGGASAPARCGASSAIGRCSLRTRRR